jgi:uncharacterized OB-fold protein
MTTYPHPAPNNEWDARFWNAIARGRLELQLCAECGTFRHPPGPVCAQCGATTSEWVESAGRGEVWSFTVIHPPTLPAFRERTPYGAVVIRLDEGVFMVSNLVDTPVEQLATGARVTLAITEVDDGVYLPLFRAG